MNIGIDIVAIDFVVDPSTLHRSSSGNITGLVRFDVREKAFPDEHWNDLVVALISDWYEILRGLKGVPGESATLSFFDGPFVVDIVVRDFGIFECSGRDLHQGVLFVAAIAAEHLRHNFRRAALVLLQECDRQGWKSDEIERLRSAD